MKTESHFAPLPAALLSQLFGALIAAGLIALLRPGLFAVPLAVAGAQGVCAALVSVRLGAPRWWPPIHLAFMPLVVLVHGLDIEPAWYLAGFLVLLLVFWRTDRSRVPLFLSNEATIRAVAALLPKTPCDVVDLGCGSGRLVRRLAQLRPDCRFVGIEHAPLPWLWARMTTAGLSNCEIRYGDFWRCPLGGFGVVYAFLSPSPMPRLWLKAKDELAPGALLVSNSFAIPGVTPTETVDVRDRRQTRLFCYRAPAEKGDEFPRSRAIAPEAFPQ